MAEQYVGKRIGRVEGLDKASGRAMYAGDYFLPGMLELALVRSQVPHGLIKAVDLSGVPQGVQVFTAKDLPENIIEDVIEDQPVLAFDRVRFHGEPVAIVAAQSREAAREAAKLVRVEYEPLPVVGDVFQAMAEGAPAVHERGNLLAEFENEKGSVERGFSQADLVLEDDFFTPIQDHAYMEPEAAFSFLAQDGCLTVYSSTQNVFHDLRMICRALALPQDRVRVQAATVGGGFGGKDGNTAQIFAAAVSWLTGKPARLVFDRTESLRATYKRHSASMHVKIGFRKDGLMTAFDGIGYLDTGAYAGLGPAVLGLFSEHFAGPYKTEHVRVRTRLLYTNKPPSHAMRGFGSPQGAFATETLISRAARQLGVDPVQIRVMNALEKGSVASLGQTMEHCVGYREALRLVEGSDLWREQKTNADPEVAYGIAGGFLSCGLGKNIPDTAQVALEELAGGRYRVKIGIVDIGQGSRTALHAMAADALGVGLGQVELVMADTRETFDCGSAAGSRSTFIVGSALLNAIKAYRGQRGRGGCTAVTGKAAFPESGKAFAAPGFPHAMYTFIAQAVKLRLNRVTGQVELLDIFAATEAGRVINPLAMDGQMQGGIAMSLGMALGENCVFEEGVLRDADFSTYLLPTALDVPRIGSAQVRAYEDSGPMGVKGAAEVATVSIAPTIGAAIEQLSEARLNRLPFDIEKILFQVLEK